MIQIEQWILDDIRRLRKIPLLEMTSDDVAYASLLSSYTKMVQDFNRKLRKMKRDS